jgi:hypothetical protein
MDKTTTFIITAIVGLAIAKAVIVPAISRSTMTIDPQLAEQINARFAQNDTQRAAATESIKPKSNEYAYLKQNGQSAIIKIDEFLRSDRFLQLPEHLRVSALEVYFKERAKTPAKGEVEKFVERFQNKQTAIELDLKQFNNNDFFALEPKEQQRVMGEYIRKVSPRFNDEDIANLTADGLRLLYSKRYPQIPEIQ